MFIDQFASLEMRGVFNVGPCRTLWNEQVSHGYNADAGCKLERDEPMPNIGICTGKTIHTISKIENRSNSNPSRRRVRLDFRIVADPGEDEEEMRSVRKTRPSRKADRDHRTGGGSGERSTATKFTNTATI
jgi:hypothetical protein